MNSVNIDLTKGNIFYKILIFTWPILATQVIEMLFVAVDRVIVGQFIGANALGGIGVSSVVIMFVVSVSGGIFIGSMVLVSQSFGAKDFVKLKKVVVTSYYFLIPLTIGATVIGYNFCEYILSLMNTPQNLMQDATTYLKIYFLGMLGMYGFFSLRFLAQGVGDVKTPLYFLMFAVALNLILNIVFVVGFGFGIEGVAYATVISQMTAFISSAIYYAGKNHLVRLSFDYSLFNFSYLKEILSIGIPGAIHFGVVSSFAVIIQVFVNSFGSISVSAFSASSQIDAIFVAIFASLSHSVSSFAGQNKGARDINRMKQGLLKSLFLVWMLALFSFGIVFLFGENLLGLFSVHQDIIAIGYNHLITVSMFYMLLGSVFCLEGFFEGAGKAHYSMITSILMITIFILSANSLSSLYGLNGLWYSLGLAQLVSIFILVMFYIFGKHFDIRNIKID